LEIVRACYEWQISNLKVDGWAKKLKEELEKIGLVYSYIWQSQSEININACKIISERCNDIEMHNIFSDINVKISLIFYCYIDKCTRKERVGIIWLKEGIWKLRGIGRGEVPPMSGGGGC
jgi:hypothetical protein